MVILWRALTQDIAMQIVSTTPARLTTVPQMAKEPLPSCWILWLVSMSAPFRLHWIVGAGSPLTSQLRIALPPSGSTQLEGQSPLKTGGSGKHHKTGRREKLVLSSCVTFYPHSHIIQQGEESYFEISWGFQNPNLFESPGNIISFSSHPGMAPLHANGLFIYPFLTWCVLCMCVSVNICVKVLLWLCVWAAQS